MLISRSARQKYQFDEYLLDAHGHAIFPGYAAARRFAEQMSAVHGASGIGSPVPASDINAMALIDEIFHIVIRQYAMQNPGLMTRAVAFLQSGLGPRLGDLLARFVEAFPPQAVYRGQLSIQDYLAGMTGGILNVDLAVEELLLINAANANPAIGPYKVLFDDSALKAETAYDESIRLLGDFFARQPAFGGRGGGETLFDILSAPAKASPYSLTGQLEFLLNQWGAILGEKFIQRILRSLDFIREEIIHRAGPAGFSSAPVISFGGEPEYERFSPDQDWMPRLVLLAKNAYVWLDQLSKWYGRWLTRLDQIPDEELDTLGRRGITGLWLIGVWERSRASQRIKQMMGNPEAAASAYSLYDYTIAADLGGDEAYYSLRARAWQRGIRLAADMVPNHMGIDSKWVIEHPDWFLSLPYPPYPGYSFNGPDLSQDERVGIFIEDHYYNKTDAAVVFKRTDRWTGDARYIYHGNDGTSFPWNDTAQLDYLKPEVREAVIQTILSVARRFPVIRFDAAMTLAKKHIQRLWFPEPGAGGAIPSRSEHGMTRAQFDEAMPREFWREVVDRVAAELPDTLLLAEAFWLMEGYFVRTLGMHRVYNSAFMHMLRDEDNAKYRKVMKNVLEFDPQVLKRFVNFMNNPDEKTAIEQFGNGDKYFGIATLMCTLPGLPMFGHGQFEGFREKYGMEYRRAYWDEHPDEGLIHAHEWRIVPLLHRRPLFAEVGNFLLYDFFTPDGQVNEDVFAFSNRSGGERGLVIYHNKFSDTSGWVRTSAAFMDKGTGKLVQRTLKEGLDIRGDALDYLIFRDYVSGLEYIRSGREIAEKGLYVSLGAYQCHTFLDFREILDSDGRWEALCAALNGAGVSSVDGRLSEMFPPIVEVTQPVEEKPETEKSRKSGAKGRTALKKSAPKKAKPAAKAKVKRDKGKSAEKKGAAEKTKHGGMVNIHSKKNATVTRKVKKPDGAKKAASKKPVVKGGTKNTTGSKKPKTK
jgi:glycosidase